jgi:photosystem II stability/assembly factor-like uncharacterized protein
MNLLSLQNRGICIVLLMAAIAGQNSVLLMRDLFLASLHGSFFGITAIDECTLLVYGLRGNLYRSADRGENWQKIETGTEASLMDAIVQKVVSIHIVGLG